MKTKEEIEEEYQENQEKIQEYQQVISQFQQENLKLQGYLEAVEDAEKNTEEE